MRLPILLLVSALGCSSRPAPVEAPAPPRVASPPAAAPTAATGEPKMTMHGQQVGTADASGWYPAHSTHGKFSVSMPAPFNDFEIAAASETTGAPMSIHVIGTQLSDGVKYAATCIEGGDRKPDVLTTMPADLAPGQAVRKLTVSGKPAVEFAAADRSASVRVVDVGTGVCLLTVEAQNKATLAVPPAADVQRMFDSFRLD